MKKLSSASIIQAVTLLVVSASCPPFTMSARTTLRYVDVNNTTPLSPYTNWSSAAVTIQAAVDASTANQFSGGRSLVASGNANPLSYLVPLHRNMQAVGDGLLT